MLTRIEGLQSLPWNPIKMSTSGVRQRGGPTPKKQSTPVPSIRTEEVRDNLQRTVTSQWDYKAALAIITALAFITRFWGIGHPNEVVFDEVHFGKVRSLFYRLPLDCSCSPLIGGCPSWMEYMLTMVSIVRLVLLAADLFLRCPSTVRKAPLRAHGVVCWV